MSGASPTSRSLDRLRELGWPAQKVEYWQSFGDAVDTEMLAALEALASNVDFSFRVVAPAEEEALRQARRVIAARQQRVDRAAGRPSGIRKDLWGCVDILALDGQPGSLGVQACAASSMSERARKAVAIPELKAWLAHGNRWECWGWAQRGPAGVRKIWTVRIQRVRLEGGRIIVETIESSSGAGPSGPGR